MPLAQPMRSSAAIRSFATALSATILIGAGPCGGDAATRPEDLVASVRITATISNPRVGEVTVLGATGVNTGGVQVPNAVCTMNSGDPSILLLVGEGGIWKGYGTSPGTVVVTARCAEKESTITITVRPIQVTLTVNKAGAGNGAVFVNPPGVTPNVAPAGAVAGTALTGSTFVGGTYDAGTTVVITATALAGSTFSTWGGACPAGGAATCTLTLKSNQTVTATFALGDPTRIIAVSGSLAFGSVNIGQSASLSFSITNTGNSTLTVTGMTAPPGGVFAGSWTKGEIPAGASQLVTIIFTPLAAQSYNGTLTVTCDQTSGTNTLPISGTGVGTAPTTGSGKYDGTYDFLFRTPASGGATSTINSPRYINIRNGVISSTDGAISSGTVDAAGAVRFTSVCPINSSTATWTGTMNASAVAGANVGSGGYTCSIAIGGTSNTWQLTQSR